MCKWLLLIGVMFLSGCTAYHQTYAQHPTKKLSALQHEYVQVHYGRIEYYRFGSGSPIVLIPGYLTDVSSWDRRFLIALAQQHEVIVMNNRNVGRSQVVSLHNDSKDLANDTYQLIKALELKKPALIGISMGGMIAQEVAVLHPDELGQLILINTIIAGDKSTPPTLAVQKKMLTLPTNIISRYFVALDLFFPQSQRMQMAYELAVDRFLPQDFQAIKAKPVILQQQKLVMDWVHDESVSRKISNVNLPVLILNGESDIVIPPINSITLANAFKHSQLFRWKEGGHAMIFQYPEQMAKVINHFLAA